MTFGTEKLEWCGYPMVKKNWRYVYSFRQNPRTWRTDGRTDTARRLRPRFHSISRQKVCHHKAVADIRCVCKFIVQKLLGYVDSSERCCSTAVWWMNVELTAGDGGSACWLTSVAAAGEFAVWWRAPRLAAWRVLQRKCCRLQLNCLLCSEIVPCRQMSLDERH